MFFTGFAFDTSSLSKTEKSPSAYVFVDTGLRFCIPEYYNNIIVFNAFIRLGIFIIKILFFALYVRNLFKHIALSYVSTRKRSPLE